MKINPYLFFIFPVTLKDVAFADGERNGLPKIYFMLLSSLAFLPSSAKNNKSIILSDDNPSNFSLLERLKVPLKALYHIGKPITYHPG